MYICEVSDNHAWIRILPSSVHDIFCTFNEIIQLKQINSYPQADMYRPFYSKVLIVNLNEIQFLNRSIENRDSLHRNSARRKTINNWFIRQSVFIEIWSTREVWRARKICKSRSRCSREQLQLLELQHDRNVFFSRDLFPDVMSVHNRNMKHARAIEFN